MNPLVVPRNGLFEGAVLKRCARSSLVCVTLVCFSVIAPMAQAQDNVQMAPHRAVYDITLKQARNGSSVQGVNGVMTFDLSDTCDGWATRQQMELHFTFSDSEESDITSSIATWESKNGEALRFAIKRATDGVQDQDYKGSATMKAEGGTARYTRPKDKADVILPAQTVFPTGHTRMILEKALAGEKLFMRRIFDGSDEDGMEDASAFIGAVLDGGHEAKPDGVKDAKLWSAKVWPVRIANYKIDDQSGEPDYEMELQLQQNGVARSVLLDYGEFSIVGKLRLLEAQDPKSCAPPDTRE